MPFLAPVVLALVAQDASAASGSAMPDEELLVTYCAGSEKLFVDPKDAALLQALRLLDDRLAELPSEFDFEDEIPPDVIPIVTRLFAGSSSLMLGISGEAMPGMPLPVFAQLGMPELGPGEGAQLAARVGRLMQLGGMPAPSFGPDGLAQLPGPFPAWFGSTAGNFLMAVGKTSNVGVDLTNHYLPDGVEPSFMFRLDLARIMELAGGMVEAYGGDEGAQVIQMMKMYGADKLRVNMATGTDSERRHTVLRMAGAAKQARDLGTAAEGPINTSMLKFIPKDATWAYAGSVNVRGTLELMLRVTKDDVSEMIGDSDPLEMLAGMMGGVHLMNDVVAHLGSTLGAYSSDTTGGGGFLSTVLFMELAGSDELYDAEETLGALLNGIASAQAKGYIQVRYWEHEGTDYQTLTFPGLPVPFEPTIAHAANALFVSATPSSAIAAVAQAKSGSSSLLDNKNFNEQRPGSLDGAYTVTFFDAPRLMRDGYGVVNLLSSALANATRSIRNPQRDAGIIMPSYHELLAGSKATVAISRIEGDDFIQHQQSDRSVLVGMTSGFGLISSSPLMLILPAIAFAAAADQM